MRRGAPEDGAETGGAAGAGDTRGFDTAAAVSFRTSSSCTLARSADTSPAGFVTKSTAPACRASIVSLAPFCVCAENITMGVGRSRMIACTASTPVMFGMLKSIDTTSGRRLRTFSTASLPSRAWPTTSKLPADASVFAIAPRMNIESSTMRIRITASPPAWARSTPRHIP